MIDILTPYKGEAKTGGFKYNFALFDTVLEMNGQEAVRFLTDNLFPKAPISVFYNLWYFKLCFSPKPKVLLFDSRMFPRVFLFLTLYRLFFPNVKVVCTHHHYNFLARENKWVAIFDRILEKLVLRLCNEIIVPSPYTKELTENYFPRKHITYIPLGFEKKAFPETIRKDKRNQLLFVGTVCERKGVHHFVDILKYLKNESLHLNIVGGYAADDPYYLKVKADLEKNNLSPMVTFHGRLSDDALEQQFRNNSIFVFPSHYEGFGMVLAEAMGCGLPVIAFNNSAMPYLIQDGKNGMLVKNLQTESFARAILEVITSSTKYNKLQKGAIETAKNLTSLSTQKALMEKWVRVLGFNVKF